MLLVLFPNPLRNPQNNPTASAEYAPVPGRTQSAQNANFGETALATSSGVGAGGIGSGILPGGQPSARPPDAFQPRQKMCVGVPPRQTEDELSPPCVPYFDGDNGGATYQGVTAGEIKVVFYNDLGLRGDLSGPYKPSDEQGDQTHFQWRHLTRTIKAQLRYFQKRYQTYGRTVRLIAYPSSGGPATPPPARKGDAIDLQGQHKPFAVASLVDNAQDAFRRLAEYDVHSFGWNEDVPRAVYDEIAPYLWSFGPDQESESAWSASFICRKLAGRPAKFTDDPDLKGKPRTFAIVYQKDSSRGPFLVQLKDLLAAQLEQGCGIDVIEKPFSGGGGGQAPLIMQDLKTRGITTVICYCIPVQSELSVTHMQNAATSLNYYPEWYWDHASAMDKPIWQQQYSNPRHRGFGVTYSWRQPSFRQSYAYRAYSEEEPGTVPNTRFNFEIYHIFLNLFSGIQAAGPILTPDSITKGMYTFKYIDPRNMWLPTGSYGDWGPSPQTFIETAMGWWWDPTGTPPGGRQGEGCMRVISEGRRFYTGQWPPGDDDLFDPSDPCSEDTRKINDPSSATGT